MGEALISHLSRPAQTEALELVETSLVADFEKLNHGIASIGASIERFKLD